MLIDLFGVANRYIDRNAFVNSKVLTNPFKLPKPTKPFKMIKRVLESLSQD